MNETNMLKEIREVTALENCIEKNKDVIRLIIKDLLKLQK